MEGIFVGQDERRGQIRERFFVMDRRGSNDERGRASLLQES
jgi:hypothetical protein